MPIDAGFNGVVVALFYPPLSLSLSLSRHLQTAEQCAEAGRALGLLDTTPITLTNTAAMLALPAGCHYDTLRSSGPLLVWNPRQADGTYQENVIRCGNGCFLQLPDIRHIFEISHAISHAISQLHVAPHAPGDAPYSAMLIGCQVGSFFSFFLTIRCYVPHASTAFIGLGFPSAPIPMQCRSGSLASAATAAGLSVTA